MFKYNYIFNFKGDFMKKCPNCKEQVQDSAKFCVHCGFNIKEHDEKNKNKHCPECGQKIDWRDTDE